MYLYPWPLSGLMYLRIDVTIDAALCRTAAPLQPGFRVGLRVMHLVLACMCGCAASCLTGCCAGAADVVVLTICVPYPTKDTRARQRRHSVVPHRVGQYSFVHMGDRLMCTG